MLVIIRFVIFALLLLGYLTAQAAITTNTPAELYFPTVNTVVGNPTGKITLVEFFDYQCGYCRQVPAILVILMKNNPDLRIVYRDYPLLGPQSMVAAEAALAAQQQGKYLQLHNALINSNKPLNINTIQQLAAQLGLNTVKMEEDHLSYLTQQQLRENAWFAQLLAIEGIPTFFVALTPMSTQHNTIGAYELMSPTFAELQAVINLLKE